MSSPNTRAALTVWKGRISPVFESAGRIIAVEIQSGREVSRSEHDLPALSALSGGMKIRPEPDFHSFEGGGTFRRLNKLRELGIEVLVCGAISLRSARILDSGGIRVVGWISGDVEDVIRALIENRIYDSSFMMPGCGRNRRLRRGRGRGGVIKGRRGAGPGRRFDSTGMSGPFGSGIAGLGDTDEDGK